MQSDGLEFCVHAAPPVHTVLSSAKPDSLAQFAAQPGATSMCEITIELINIRWVYALNTRKKATNLSPLVRCITKPP